MRLSRLEDWIKKFKQGGEEDFSRAQELVVQSKRQK
jgi:hypothetical protein